MLSVGKIVKFNVGDRTDFCRPYLIDGADCEILVILPNTAIVQFIGQSETDIVSLVYLKG